MEKITLDKRSKILFAILAGVFVVPPCLVLLLMEFGLVVNMTPSMPRGLYWRKSGSFARGDVVSYHAPQTQEFGEAKARGYFKVNIIKKVFGMPGDVFSVTDSGVIVNGSCVPNSTPLKSDAQGRALPQYRTTDRIVTDEEVLLLSDHSVMSFDGRYVGAVKKSDVNGVLAPLWLFE